MKIPFFEFRFSPDYRKELDSAYRRVMDKADFINGSEVKDLENEIANFLGVNNVIAVGNGYDALLIALKLISKEPLNILLQANAYPATLNAVLNAGHNPVFHNIDFINNDFGVISEDFLKANKIDLIIPIHYFGAPNRILNTMPKNVSLMEDFSQAFGTRLNGQYCGTFGKINAASLYPTKNLGAFGDAGIICTNDDGLAQSARELKNYGEIDYNNNNEIGVNSRMDELQAAFIRTNLQKLPEALEAKRKIAEYYLEELNNCGDLILPNVNSEENTFHQFTIKTDKRDDLKSYLDKKGISTKIHYPNPLFEQKAYQNLNFSNIDKGAVCKWHSSILSLPSFLGLELSELDYICKSIKSYFS